MSQPEPRLGDILAQKRADLAFDRTNLAVDRTLMGAERTMMAWVRTGLSLIGLGTLSAFMGGFDYWLAAKDLHEKYLIRIKKFPFIISGLIFVPGLWLFTSIILEAELF